MASPSPLHQQDLAGKVAVITAASKGIGRAIAINLARRGCSILGTCSASTSLPHIDVLEDEIKSWYSESDLAAPKIVGLAASILSPDHSSLVADAVGKHFNSKVDIFVNNAAATDRTPVGSLEIESVSNVLLGNVTTPAMTIDLLVKRKYFQKESRIIFISSAESTRCDPSALMYGTTKAANEAMARTYANAFGGNLPEFDFMAGTTANSLLVGLTETAWTKDVPKELFDQFKAYWHPRQSIPKMAQPAEVADIAGLLCSKEARWITGSKVCADGGAVKIL